MSGINGASNGRQGARHSTNVSNFPQGARSDPRCPDCGEKLTARELEAAEKELNELWTSGVMPEARRPGPPTKALGDLLYEWMRVSLALGRSIDCPDEFYAANPDRLLVVLYARTEAFRVILLENGCPESEVDARLVSTLQPMPGVGLQWLGLRLKRADTGAFGGYVAVNPEQYLSWDDHPAPLAAFPHSHAPSDLAAGAAQGDAEAL